MRSAAGSPTRLVAIHAAPPTIHPTVAQPETFIASAFVIGTTSSPSIVEAARSDAEAAAAYRVVLDGRAKTFARFIHELRHDLAPGLGKRTATDLLWAFSNEELWRELVEERGWSPDRYEQWLARTLVAQLLTG